MFTLEVQVDYFLNGFSVKTIVLVGIYNQQFKGTILCMVFDFQGLSRYPKDPISPSSTWRHFEDPIGLIPAIGGSDDPQRPCLVGG